MSRSLSCRQGTLHYTSISLQFSSRKCFCFLQLSKKTFIFDFILCKKKINPQFCFRKKYFPIFATIQVTIYSKILLCYFNRIVVVFLLFLLAPCKHFHPCIMIFFRYSNNFYKVVFKLFGIDQYYGLYVRYTLTSCLFLQLLEKNVLVSI